MKDTLLKNMAMQAMGAGFGQTGTKSLTIAPEELRFGKCLHMQEVMKNPRLLMQWAEVMEGGKADWDILFAGYQSGTDWPATLYYKDQEYADAMQTGAPWPDPL